MGNVYYGHGQREKLAALRKGKMGWPVCVLLHQTEGDHLSGKTGDVGNRGNVTKLSRSDGNVRENRLSLTSSLRLLDCNC